MCVYKNVMEILVEEEVVRQYKTLSADISYPKPEEIVAYSLNQLPPLYATSEQGLQYQIQRGRIKFEARIAQTVQQAIVAVRRKLQTQNTPLRQTQVAVMGNKLQELRQLYQNDDTP